MPMSYPFVSLINSVCFVLLNFCINRQKDRHGHVEHHIIGFEATLKKYFRAPVEPNCSERDVLAYNINEVSNETLESTR